MRSSPDEPGDQDADEISHLGEDEFEAMEDRVDRLAAEAQQQEAEPSARVDPTAPIRTEEDFERVVRAALDDLPQQFRDALDDVAVVVSDDGAKQGAYGVYEGKTISSDEVTRSWWPWGRGSSPLPDRIVIYRDTLTRDFGHDPQLLKQQITRVVRHEVGHHLGFDEPGVEHLGL